MYENPQSIQNLVQHTKTKKLGSCGPKALALFAEVVGEL